MREGGRCSSRLCPGCSSAPDLGCHPPEQIESARVHAREGEGAGARQRYGQVGGRERAARANESMRMKQTVERELSDWVTLE